MKNLKMKKEFKVIANLLPTNIRVLDVPEFLKTLKSFIDSMYDKFKNEKRI